MPDDNAELWVTAECQCHYCGFRWVAVYPLGCTELECKRCGIMNDLDEHV